MSLTRPLPPLPVPPPPPTPAAPRPQPDIDGKTVTDLAKEMAPEAIVELFRLGTDPDVKPAARVSALNAIIERAEGKVGILQDNSVNYNVIINQINRVMGQASNPAPPPAALEAAYSSSDS